MDRIVSPREDTFQEMMPWKLKILGDFIGVLFGPRPYGVLSTAIYVWDGESGRDRRVQQ
jgi:hypothetical protein